MFGFIEKWLADLMGVKYEPFALNSGSVAAMVNRDIYISAKNIINRFWEKNGAANDKELHEIDSDIAGMKILLYPYYYDFGVLEGLVGGRMKESETYIRMMSAGSFRVSDLEAFIKDIVRATKEAEELEPDEGIAVLADADGNPIPEEKKPRKKRSNNKPLAKPAVKEKVISEEEKEKNFLDSIQNTVCRYDNRFIADKSGKSVLISGENFFSESVLCNFADSVNKNILIIEDSGYVGRIKKLLKEDVQKYLITVITRPANSHAKFCPNKTGIKPKLFGREVKHSFSVYGEQVNKEIVTIEKSSLLSKKERDEKINKIKKDKSNSPYSEYDMIFKDVVTNVPFALRDRNFVYLLMDPYDDKFIADTMIKEVSRRFKGDIPFSELLKIDKEYQNSIEKEEKSGYIKFAVKNSQAITEELKKKFEHHKDKYQEYLKQAMEHGKLMKKFMDQLSAFDYEAAKEKERKKAEEEYDMTLALDKVLSINITGETVNIYTHNIYAQDDRSKKWHDIGTFHIRLGLHSNLYDTHNSVKMLNTKHLIKAYDDRPMQAPHVFEHGEICHGGLATGMTDAYMRRDLYQLVLQLMIFLQQANTDDSAGMNIDKWPEVNEKTALQTKKEENAEEEKSAVSESKEDKSESEFDNVLANAIEV